MAGAPSSAIILDVARPIPEVPTRAYARFLDMYTVVPFLVALVAKGGIARLSFKRRCTGNRYHTRNQVKPVKMLLSKISHLLPDKSNGSFHR